MTNATKDELTNLFTRINVNAMKARASQLRFGIPCSISPLVYNPENPYEFMGGMNFHVPITFVDGVVWLCRIRRRNASSPPEEAQDQLLLSEVATYQFLSSVSVPVPKIYDYATASTPSNLIGVGYIMMEKILGKVLDWCSLDKASKVNILQQLADIFIVLKQHPFPLIGSLEPETLTVGPIVGQETYDVDDGGRIQSLGPFKSALDYRKAQVQQQLDFLIRRETWKDRATDGYLAFQYLSENVPAFVHYEQTKYPQFYLKHMDDKGDHILVDSSNNIVAIIDWEFAQTSTPSEAFAAPLFLIDVTAYYDGKNDLSEDEALWASILEQKGHQDLAFFVREGRRQHRFAFCLGCGMNPEDIPTMILGFIRATKKGSDKENWESWRKNAFQRRKNDIQLQVL